MAKKLAELGIKSGIKYPFNNFSRLFNFYWVLIPIIGAFAIIGYAINIVKEIVNGNDKELPAFGSFGENLKQGFILFIYMIPLILLVVVCGIIPFINYLFMIVFVLCLPILYVNYAVKREFKALYDFKYAFNVIFKDFGDYIWTYIKHIILSLIWLVFSIPIITLIITAPASTFTKQYFFADYYRRNQ